MNYISAAVVGIIFFVLYLMVNAFAARKDRLKKFERDARLTRSYSELGLAEGIESVELEQDYSPLAQSLHRMMDVFGFDVDKNLKEWRTSAMRAGMTSPNAPIFLMFYQRIAGYLIALFGGMILMMTQDNMGMMLFGGLLMIIGLFGSKLLVSNNTAKRKKSLLRSFPDGLDLMVVCVESGLALDAAVNRVCDELSFAHPALAVELNQTRLELALLNNRSQALMNLAERTDLVAYRSLVAALIQTERFGTSLTDTLRVLSDDYRQTRLMIAEEKAGRLPALISIPLITCLLPALMLLVLGPAAIKVMAMSSD
ncbi:MAG: type II secretion system F family protein [Alphaproteobacteria bacterium]|nr:MAG: type II secretion system F family protein [Alphaproteobacteria bacterium]